MTLHPSVPRQFCMAFYKGTRPGLEGVQNRIGRFLDRGPYSHTELLFSDGLSASASWIDGGVRFKPIRYRSAGSWDFLPIPDPDGARESAARQWFDAHLGLPYDLMGNLRFATNFARDSAARWFCSESCMAALGFAEAFRYGPSGMVPVLQKFFNADMIRIAKEPIA